MDGCELLHRLPQQPIRLDHIFAIAPGRTHPHLVSLRSSQCVFTIRHIWIRSVVYNSVSCNRTSNHIQSQLPAEHLWHCGLPRCSIGQTLSTCSTGSAGMDGGQNPAGRAQQNLIRPEQVGRLPHLTQEQKQSVYKRVQASWDYINANSGNQSDPKLQQAFSQLASLSNTLMQGMKAHNQQKAARGQTGPPASQQPQQPMRQQNSNVQQPQQQQQQPPPSSAPNNTSPFPPEIMARVNATIFVYPPAMQEGEESAKTWLNEAKMRYGQALNRAQLAKTKKADLEKMAAARAQAGIAVSDEERKNMEQKLQQCEEALQGARSFMEKFREQQNQFRQQRQTQANARFAQQGANPVEQREGNIVNTQPQVQHQQASVGPTAHSIATAQAAARAQAADNLSGAMQISSQTAGNTGQTPLDSSQPFNTQSQISAIQQQAAQASRPGTAVPQSAIQQQAAMQAQVAAAAAAQQSSHAHPQTPAQQNLMISVAAKMAAGTMPKNMQTSDPVPVAMPPSRPTLNGGAGIGLPGQLQQPALQAMPGYVLETSEDGHITSRKKLQELVREVMGPHSEDMLTSDAEEVSRGHIDIYIYILELTA